MMFLSVLSIIFIISQTNSHPSENRSQNNINRIISSIEFENDQLKDILFMISDEIGETKRALAEKDQKLEASRTMINELQNKIDILKADYVYASTQEIQFVAVVQNPTLHYSLPSGTITFDELLVNSPSSPFDPTTGKFTAVQEGIYIFNFDGFVYGECKHGFLHFYLNGADIGHYVEQNTDSISSRGISGIRAMTLKSGDEIKLSNENGGCIYGDDFHPFTFMGTYLGKTTLFN